MKIKKGDYFLIASVLIFALAVWVCLFFVNTDKQADTVVITLNGAEYKRLSLNADYEIKVESENGFNIVEIKDGKVFVSEASCAGQDCVHQKSISRCGESIVCLPNRLTVTIVGDGGYDATAW